MHDGGPSGLYADPHVTPFYAGSEGRLRLSTTGATILGARPLSHVQPLIELADFRKPGTPHDLGDSSRVVKQ